MGTGIPVKWPVAGVPGSRRSSAPSARCGSPSARRRSRRRTPGGWQPNRRLSGTGFGSTAFCELLRLKSNCAENDSLWRILVVIRKRQEGILVKEVNDGCAMGRQYSAARRSPGLVFRWTETFLVSAGPFGSSDESRFHRYARIQPEQTRSGLSGRCPGSAIIGDGPEALSVYRAYRSARACFLRLSLSAGVKGLQRRAARRQGNRKG